MSGVTKIEWADRVWNPVTGCSKVSEGCRNCYAEALSLRFKRSVGPWNAVNAPQNVVLHPDRLADPLKWRQPARVFVNSMSDLFHELVSDDYIDRVFGVMALAQRHTFLVLTKRPERMRAWFAERFQVPYGNGTIGTEDRSDRVFAAMQDFTDPRNDDHFTPDGSFKWPGWPLPNVWLGTSTEDQRTADERIPLLLNTPAAVRWLSCEPLLGPINLRAIPDPLEPGEWRFDALAGGWYLPASEDGYPEQPGDGPDMGGLIHWVITGGESGPRHRPMDLDWARSLRDQCVAAGVAFFFKQVGGRTPKAGGRELDGRTWDQFPEVRP